MTDARTSILSTIPSHASHAWHFPISKAIYTLLGTLGNGIGLAAALGVWAMVFLLTSPLGATTLAGKRGGLFNRTQQATSFESNGRASSIPSR